MTDRHLASDRMDLVRRRALLPVLLLCLLAVCAAAASGASAATLYKCERNTGKGDYKNALCTEPGVIGASEYGKAVPLGVKTPLTESSTTPFYINWDIAGIAFEIKCSSLSSTGYATNVEESKVMQVKGEEIRNRFTGCALEKGPPECTVPATLETNPATSITFTEGGVIYDKFTPTAYNYIEVPFSNCANASFDTKFPLAGHIVGRISGATVIFDEGSNKKGTFPGEGLAQGSILGTELSSAGGAPAYIR